MDLTSLQVAAVQKMMEVSDCVLAIQIEGESGRALVSEATSEINVMRGKTDDKKRWQAAIIEGELPEEVRPLLKPGGKITLTALSLTVSVEEQDFVRDAGVVTFFMS